MVQSHVIANIRAEMARQNKTQADLAELLGVTRQSVSRRMVGQVDFGISELTTIAEFLDVPIADLLGGEKASA